MTSPIKIIFSLRGSTYGIYAVSFFEIFSSALPLVLFFSRKGEERNQKFQRQKLYLGQRYYLTVKNILIGDVILQIIQLMCSRLVKANLVLAHSTKNSTRGRAELKISKKETA